VISPACSLVPRSQEPVRMKLIPQKLQGCGYCKVKRVRDKIS